MRDPRENLENPNEDRREPAAHHTLLHQKLKASFAPTYMTALSVIQGVALADLGAVVAANHAEFSLEQWLLAALSLATLILVWDAYTTLSTLWDWVQDLRDAAIPFVFGALELFLNHSIVLSLSSWLLALALLAAAAVLTNWYSGWRAAEEAENSRLLGLLSGSGRSTLLYTIGLSLFLFLLAAVSQVGGVEATESVRAGQSPLALVVALLAGAGLGIFAYLNLRNWRQVIVYARTGRRPTQTLGDRGEVVE